MTLQNAFVITKVSLNALESVHKDQWVSINSNRPGATVYYLGGRANDTNTRKYPESATVKAHMTHSIFVKHEGSSIPVQGDTFDVKLW